MFAVGVVDRRMSTRDASFPIKSLILSLAIAYLSIEAELPVVKSPTASYFKYDIFDFPVDLLLPFDPVRATISFSPVIHLLFWKAGMSKRCRSDDSITASSKRPRTKVEGRGQDYISTLSDEILLQILSSGSIDTLVKCQR